MTFSVTAIIPMRHNSERVPGKNYRSLAGIPLYHHVARALSQTPEVSEIIIDTDSDFIADDARENFPSIRVVPRPEHLRDGSIAMNDVLANTLTHVNTDAILQTHSTNPFVTAATFSSALRAFENGQHEIDSVFSVTRLQNRLWDAEGKPVNHDPLVLLRTQDLAPLYIENSCFYIFTKAQLRETGNRIGARPLMHEVDPLESIDIDEERDFALAQAVAESRALVR